MCPIDSLEDLAVPADADRRGAWTALRSRYLAADAAVGAVDRTADDETAIRLCEQFRALEERLLLTPAPDESSLREKFAAFREFVAEELDFSLLTRPALASLEADALSFAWLAAEHRALSIVTVPPTQAATTECNGTTEELHRRLRTAAAIGADLQRKAALLDLAFAGRAALNAGDRSPTDEALASLSLELADLIDRLGRALGISGRGSVTSHD